MKWPYRLRYTSVGMMTSLLFLKKEEKKTNEPTNPAFQALGKRCLSQKI